MLTEADKRYLRNRQSRNDRSVGELWRVIGIREDGSDRLGDLLTQMQATQARLDALSVAVKVLEERQPPR